MTTVSAVAAILVGVAFVVAGASKLAAGHAWPAQAVGLGAPRWTAAVVPWIELAVGSLLVVQLFRQPAAIGAACLLVAFTVLIVVQLRAGRRPPCACFGAWSAKPIGVAHIVRNAVLFALAVVAAW